MKNEPADDLITLEAHELKETDASLRIMGDDLDPDEVTRLLGALPTKGSKKGEFFYTSTGSRHRSRTGIWALQVEHQRPGNLDKQIEQLLEPLTDDLAIWNDLAARFKLEIFCGLFTEEYNSRMTLAPNTVLALGSRGIVIDFDIYADLDGAYDALLQRTGLFKKK